MSYFSLPMAIGIVFLPIAIGISLYNAIFALEINYTVMIQRIQTLYLTLAFAATVLLFVFPLAQFFSETGTYIFSVTGLKNMVPGDPEAFNPMIFLPLIIVTVGIALLALFTILQFKRRPLQVKLTSAGVFATIALIMGIFFLYIPVIEKKINIIPNYLDSTGKISG